MNSIEWPSMAYTDRITRPLNAYTSASDGGGQFVVQSMLYIDLIK